jgi:MoxR-like ATPase
VDGELVAEIVAKWTGILVSRMLEGESEKLIKMEDRLRARVVGQDEALTLVANAIRRARSGLADPNKPIGSFIFLGPTGVGKTETARALASFLFNDDQAIVRIDMSEYQEKHTVARLIGAPPGYVGYEEGGQLTEAVRRRPYSIILFDEIEKAHPEVFNVLLQLLDDGRLTDGQGRTVSFRNTVIIMTSNLGSQWIQQYGTSDYDKMRSMVMETLKEGFKPEFLNRIDEIVIYHALPLERIKEIVDIQIGELEARLAERHLKLMVTDKAREYLVKEGYDPAYGSRPLKWTLQRKIQDPLALMLLDGKFAEGDTVLVDLPIEKRGWLFLSYIPGLFRSPVTTVLSRGAPGEKPRMGLFTHLKRAITRSRAPFSSATAFSSPSFMVSQESPSVFCNSFHFSLTNPFFFRSSSISFKNSVFAAAVNSSPLASSCSIFVFHSLSCASIRFRYSSFFSITILLCGIKSQTALYK